MIQIPLYVFLFVYLLFLVVFLIFSLIHVYHIIATASLTLTSFLFCLLIFFLTIITLYATMSLLPDIDWKTPVTLLDASWLGGLFSP